MVSDTATAWSMLALVTCWSTLTICCSCFLVRTQRGEGDASRGSGWAGVAGRGNVCRPIKPRIWSRHGCAAPDANTSGAVASPFRRWIAALPGSSSSRPWSMDRWCSWCLKGPSLLSAHMVPNRCWGLAAGRRRRCMRVVPLAITATASRACRAAAGMALDYDPQALSAKLSTIFWPAVLEVATRLCVADNISIIYHSRHTQLWAWVLIQRCIDAVSDRLCSLH